MRFTQTAFTAKLTYNRGDPTGITKQFCGRLKAIIHGLSLSVGGVHYPMRLKLGFFTKRHYTADCLTLPHLTISIALQVTRRIGKRACYRAQ